MSIRTVGNAENGKLSRVATNNLSGLYRGRGGGYYETNANATGDTDYVTS